MSRSNDIAGLTTSILDGVTAAEVGLGNVTNESKATMFASPTFTGTVSGLTIADGGNIGSVSDTEAISISSDGGLTFSGGIDNAGTISAGTIGSGVTITDGANPHGWEHIKTISYNADTATPQKMSNVVSSTYSAYKLYIQWGSDDSSNRDLVFRFLDSSDNALTSAKYSYAGLRMTEDGGAGTINFYHASNDEAQISNDSLEGSRGFNGEMTFFNCYASSSAYPQIDGHQLANNDTGRPANPHCYYTYTGHDQGSFDMRGDGFLWYDVNEQYVSGFQLYWSGGNVCKGSFWSCYGLKLPTAD